MRSIMKQEYRLSNITKDYLSEFDCILQKMIRDMTEVCLSDSISYNFMIQMIPHHLAAIEMSRNLLKYSRFAPLRNIAENIIIEQTESIRNMKRSLCSCKEMCNSDQALRVYQDEADDIMHIMFHDMKHARTVNNINADFMYEMIPHHKGAIRLSENALQYNLCPGLIPILQAIIRSQKKGVAKMTRLLKSPCFQSSNILK